jgi:hypothetical protein
MYNAPAMQPGQELQLLITGQPQNSSPTLTATSSTSLLLGAGVLGVVLIAAGLWFYWRNRPEPDEEEEELPDAGGIEESTEALMDAILALDDLYQEGKLPEDAYLQRRAELKQRLERAMEI